MLKFVKVVTVVYIMVGIGISVWASYKTQEETKRKKISNKWRYVLAILIILFWPILLIDENWRALDESWSKAKKEQEDGN